LGIGNITAVGIIGIFFLSVLLVFFIPEVYAHYDMSAPAFQSTDLVTDCAASGFGDGINDTIDMGDMDGDSICDAWEPGELGGPDMFMTVNYPQGTTYVYECGPGTADPICPRKDHKDIFVEVDFMEGHKPRNSVVNLVTPSFAAVPNSAFAIPNPDNTDGINIHLQIDEKVLLHAPDTIFEGMDSNPILWGFPQIKKEHFGTNSERGPDWATGAEHWRAKQQVFHYALFVHNLYGSDATGIGEGAWGIGGNDFMVSLGNFAGGAGSPQEKAGTFMHELGHNLGLDHGGHDVINCKPNYFSIMSHSRQMPILYTERDLDYSRTIQGAKSGGTQDYLDETSLDERKGIEQSDPPAQKAIYGPDPPLKRKADKSVDWDRDGVKAGIASEDINNIIILAGIADCPSTYANPTDTEILEGHDDWETIKFDFREDPQNTAGGLGTTVGGSKLKMNVAGPPLSADDIIKRFPELEKNRAEIESHFSAIEYTSLEFTREMAINQHKARIDALDYIIENATGSRYDSQISYGKEQGNIFETIKDLIDQENFEKASIELEGLKKEFTNPEILSEIDNIILSHTLATQFTPTEVHTKYGAASCDNLNVLELKTEKIQVRYCIVNGKLVSGNLDFDKKAFVLDISPTSDGEITLSIPKELIESETMVPSTKFKVSTAGKPLEFHTENSDSENIALTIGFPRTTSTIEIMSPDLKPSKPDRLPPGIMIDSPRKQMEIGVAITDIECKTGLTLMEKYTGSAACVKSTTAEKLEKAKWGTIIIKES